MLSFLNQINEPISNIANYKLTTLIDRWYFCEPNKFCFTIFGHLQNLLSFFKVQLKTKLNKYLLSHWKMKNRFLPTRPTSERLGPLLHHARARVTHDTAHVGAWPSRAMMAHDGEACTRRSSSKNTPILPGNRANTNSTISPVCYLTPTPLPLFSFTTTILSGLPRVHQHGGADTGGYAGETSPSPPYLQSRYLTMLEREALSEGSMSQDAIVRPIHGGELLH